MTAPYDMAPAYRARGWAGTLPLPAGKKEPPPGGFTGYDGQWPTTPQVAEWQAEGGHNLALRLPPVVIGLDVDAYGDKPGGRTLAELVSRWGSLPATWTTTSREDGASGIRLYRVPADIADWPTEAGAGIEIIRHAHRYAVVPPSMHPEGRPYRWLRPDGSVADGELPGLGDLPELPAAWLAGLTGHGGSGEHVKPGSRAALRERGKPAAPWLRALPKGEPCGYVGRLAAELEGAARREDGNAYDHTRDAVMALLGAGEIGHPGVLAVLDGGRAIYVATVAETRGGATKAGAEYDRFTVGGVVKILEHPSERTGTGCDCEPAILMVNGKPIGEPAAPAGATTWPEPEDRGTAALSALGEVAYVEDLIRPGRIVVVAAEEGTGKSYAITGELGIRLAVAGGSFAGTWPILQTGPVLVLSEMHPDDDYQREAAILDALELTRESLVGRYFRLALASAAGDQPALQVPAWREWITDWLRERGALLAVFDTATAAAQVDPWGTDIQAVYRGLRMMTEQYPELAIVLIVHLKKPQGRGERRISDVLGEWGRWCDVLLLLEADGLERVKLTARKRVHRERRIVATKRDGLLVEPQDLTEGSGPRVPPADVLAAIRDEPGLSIQRLAARLGVSRSTARKYAEEVPGIVLLPGKRGALTCHLSVGDGEATDMSVLGEGVGDVSPVTPYIEKGVTDTSLLTSRGLSHEQLQKIVAATGGELLPEVPV